MEPPEIIRLSADLLLRATRLGNFQNEVALALTDLYSSIVLCAILLERFTVSRKAEDGVRYLERCEKTSAAIFEMAGLNSTLHDILKETLRALICGHVQVQTIALEEGARCNGLHEIPARDRNHTADS